MAKLISDEYIVNAQNESNLSITSNDINMELNNEFLVELQKGAYHGWIDEDVVNHVAKVLEMVDLIYVPGVDSHRLRMKAFPLSLADDARQWWISEGKKKLPFGKNLLRKFSINFILNHTMEKKKCWTEEITGELIHLNSCRDWNKRRIDDSILSNNNITTDSFFKPCLITRGKCDTEKEDEQSKTKRKYSNTFESINEKPYKRICKAENLEAIQYSFGPNEEYIAIRRCEYDIWERNEYNMSKIYQDIFQKKDNR
ncbi:hypothetical protein Tco_1447221 [Tanacetum coccineum]